MYGKKKKDIKNIISWILFGIIIVLIFIIGYFVIDLKMQNNQYKKDIKNYKLEIKELKDQLIKQENNKDEISKVEIEPELEVKEEYFVSHSSVWMKPDPLTTLVLEDDGTFSMNVNVCSGVGSINGKYTKNDNQIILNDIEYSFTGFVGDNLESITFDFQDEGNLKINNQVGCVFEGSIFSKK